MGRERLEAEFGRYATWVAEAVDGLDIADPIPAACRGTGDPLLLERLARSIAVRPGMRFLDVGCGLGGPAAWLNRACGCLVVGVDVMELAVHGLRRMFSDLPAV